MSNSDKPICVFQSPMWTRSGYGDWGLAVAKSLLRYNKFDLYMFPTKWGACSRKNLEKQMKTEEEKILFSKILRTQLPRQPEVYIQMTIPNEFQPLGKFNIGMTAGIETTLCRGDWLEGMNRMNINVVLSEHIKTVFESTSATKSDPNNPSVPPQSVKVEKPMRVIFWGSDTSIYKPVTEISETVNESLKSIPESFCFLFIGQWTSGGLYNDRKDVGNLIKTFLETFQDMEGKETPALIIKTSGAAICNMDKYDMIARIKAITNDVSSKSKTVPNVYLLYGDLDEIEMNSLLNHPRVKAHVSFTHGEGFGHPLLISTLSAKPVLASSWSGHIDFLNPKLCQLLAGELKVLPPDCVNEWLIKDSAWFYVNYDYAKEKFRNVFYHYGAYRKKAEELAKENSEKFSTQAMDLKFHGFLDEVIPKFATEQKLVLPRLKKISLPTLKK